MKIDRINREASKYKVAQKIDKPGLPNRGSSLMQQNYPINTAIATASNFDNSGQQSNP